MKRKVECTVSLDIERSIAILSLTSHAACGRRSRTSDQRMGGASAGRRRSTAQSLPRTTFCRRWSGFRSANFDCFPFSNCKVPSHPQLASLLANQHERAKEEMKCLLRAQAAVGVALTNNGSTSTTTFVCDPIVGDTQSSLFGSRKGRCWAAF